MSARHRSSQKAFFERRPHGWLHNEVLRVLDVCGKPLTAQAIALRIAESELGIHHSSVFRVVGQLLETQAIDRIEALASYVLHRPFPTLTMICCRCDVTTTADAGVIRTVLDDVAEAKGFQPRRYVTEIVGYCIRCTASEDLAINQLEPLPRGSEAVAAEENLPPQQIWFR